MKTLLSFLILTVFIIHEIQSQNVPQGMKYQAVARDLSGNILADQDITLKVSLHNAEHHNGVEFVEMHDITTNKLGLFSITIGKGKIENGLFEDIPWSTNEIYLAVSILDEKSDQFVGVSDSKLLAVPYAFHAATANELANDGGNLRGPKDDGPGFWALDGNTGTAPGKHKLGTIDRVDMIVVTSGVERMRIKALGDIETQRSFSTGEDLTVGKDLHVKNQSQLDGELVVMSDTKLTANLGVHGNTVLRGEVTVENMSPTHLTGSLQVDGETNLGGDLTVQNMASTYLTGSLVVDGEIKFEGGFASGGSAILFDSLVVLDNSPAILTGTLDVDGTTTMNDDLFLDAELKLTAQSSDFIATFENTDSGNGDGIKIQLGKTHPRWNGSKVELVPPGLGLVSDAVGASETLIRNIISSGGFDLSDFEQFGLALAEITEDHLAPGFDFVVAESCNLTNDIIDELNSKLGLPLEIGPYATPAKNLSSDFVIFGDGPDDDDDPDLVIPGVSVPSLSVIGKIELVPLIPMIPDCPTSPSFDESFDLPNFQLVNVDNSLSSDNIFIQFTDEEDRQLGAIQAQTIEEWGVSYLNVNYFLNVFNSFAGVTVIGIDPIQIAETAGKYFINGIAQLSNVVEGYNAIGVQYNSGFGDYAEWLERADHSERISAGDIVGVIGGKISKDLKNAEQIMAVSTNPIVLGNAPEEKEEPRGNKVAFMGQIPVKIMGPVASGDFIVAHGDIPGYGKAVHPKDMTIEDFELAVGRSWEAVVSEGPKMVNTVVGVHNGSMLNVMKNVVAKQETTDTRLSNIEEQLSALLPIVKSEK